MSLSFQGSIRSNFSREHFDDVAYCACADWQSKGETVEVETPGGAKVYQIWKVEWLGSAQHR